MTDRLRASRLVLLAQAGDRIALDALLAAVQADVFRFLRSRSWC